MDYGQLQTIDRKNSELWSEYARRAAGIIQEALREFQYYLKIGEAEKALTISPIQGRNESDPVEHTLEEMLEWGDEGWVESAFRLVIGQNAYLIRFLLKEDGDCWILKLFEDRSEYTLSHKDQRANREELIPFFDQISDTLGDRIDMDFDNWLSGTLPERPGFLIDEKDVSFPSTPPLPPPENRIHGIFPFLSTPR